jgi:hypothetical protein
MPKPVPRERAYHRDLEVAGIINQNHRYGLRIALEARAYDIWPSVLAAVIEQESGFRNVYGHDAVKWPQIKGGNVTRLNYARYKQLRKMGLGMQGVGPGQLTWWEFQDEADRSGGCWRPAPNIATTAWLLASLRRKAGSWAHAYELYNAGKTGTTAGRAYSQSVRRRARAWHERLG